MAIITKTFKIGLADSEIGDYVDKTSTQTISGQKTFTSQIKAVGFAQSDTTKAYIDFITGTNVNFGIKGNASTIYDLSTFLTSSSLNSYLPLSGGAMTGVISFTPNQYYYNGKYALDMENSDIINANCIYMNDVAETTSEGIRFYRDGSKWDTLTASGGVLYFMPNDIFMGSELTSAKKVAFQGDNISLFNNNSGYATQTWVQNQGYITSYNDTKNTTGTNNKTGEKLFIVGALIQSANPITYSNSNCYIGTDNCLYSNGSKVSTSNTWRTIKVNDTSIGTNELNLKDGTNVSISVSGGVAQFSARNYYHTSVESSGLKIATGSGVNDLYVKYATSSGTVGAVGLVAGTNVSLTWNNGKATINATTSGTGKLYKHILTIRAYDNPLDNLEITIISTEATQCTSYSDVYTYLLGVTKTDWYGFYDSENASSKTPILKLNCASNSSTLNKGITLVYIDNSNAITEISTNQNFRSDVVSIL